MAPSLITSKVTYMYIQPQKWIRMCTIQTAIKGGGGGGGEGGYFYTVHAYSQLHLNELVAAYLETLWCC